MAKGTETSWEWPGSSRTRNAPRSAFGVAIGLPLFVWRLLLGRLRCASRSRRHACGAFLFSIRFAPGSLSSTINVAPSSSTRGEEYFRKSLAAALFGSDFALDGEYRQAPEGSKLTWLPLARALLSRLELIRSAVCIVELLVRGGSSPFRRRSQRGRTVFSRLHSLSDVASMPNTRVCRARHPATYR
jgi:hypothetical protein